MEWQLVEGGGYSASFDGESQITPLDKVTVVVDGDTYEAVFNFSQHGFLFLKDDAPFMFLTNQDDDTYIIMILAEPASDHITITAVENEESNTFYQGTVNCDTQSSGEVQLWYGSFTANYTPTNKFIYGEVDGVTFAGGTFSGSTLQLNNDLAISHTGGYNYSLLNYATSGPVTLNLKCIDIS